MLKCALWRWVVDLMRWILDHRIVSLLSLAAAIITIGVFITDLHQPTPIQEAAGVPDPEPKSHWKIDVESVPSTRAVASLEAGGSTEDRVTLIVACGWPAPFRLNVVIDWHYSLRSIASYEFDVQYRFDSGQFVSDTWNRTTPRAILMSGREDIRRFVEEIKRSDQLEVQILSDVPSTMAATFDLEGAGDPITRIVEACE